MTATLEVPALQVIDITKHYDVRVRKITTAMEFRTYLSVLRGKKDRQMTALDKVNFTIARPSSCPIQARPWCSGRMW